MPFTHKNKIKTNITKKPEQNENIIYISGLSNVVRNILPIYVSNTKNSGLSDDGKVYCIPINDFTCNSFSCEINHLSIIKAIHYHVKDLINIKTSLRKTIIYDDMVQVEQSLERYGFPNEVKYDVKRWNIVKENKIVIKYTGNGNTDTKYALYTMVYLYEQLWVDDKTQFINLTEEQYAGVDNPYITLLKDVLTRDLQITHDPANAGAFITQKVDDNFQNTDNVRQLLNNIALVIYHILDCDNRDPELNADLLLKSYIYSY